VRLRARQESVRHPESHQGRLRYGQSQLRGGPGQGVRTIAVKGFPAPGALPSEGLRAAWPRLMACATTLLPGYSMQIGGEYAKQQQGFANLMIVLAISVAAIYLALVFQFKSAIKPW